MDYSFVRKLVKDISSKEAQKLCQMLTTTGIEVFYRTEDGVFFNICTEGLFEKNDLYVSAADLEAARVLVKEIGLEAFLCDDTEANENVGKSEVEKAEEEFYRKHKQNQVFAWGIIGGVIIFMFFHFFQ